MCDAKKKLKMNEKQEEEEKKKYDNKGEKIRWDKLVHIDCIWMFRTDKKKTTHFQFHNRK